MKPRRRFRKSPENVSNDEIDFDEFIKFSKYFFSVVTFDFAAYSTKKSFSENFKIILCDIFFWFSAINVCLFVTLSVVNLKSFDMNAFTFAMPLLTSVSLVVVKCLTVYCNKSNISELIYEMKIVFPRDKRNQKKYNIKSYFENYRLFARVYAVMFMIPSVCVMAIPLIKLASSGSRTFPLNVWIPFEYERDEVVYMVCYVWSIWACANSVLILIAMDTLCFVLITLVSMEFDILRLDFASLTSAATLNIDRHVGKFIQRHNNLIEFNKKLEKVFSPSFLFNFVQSIFVICLTAFLYTTSSEPIQLIMNGSYCAAVLNQIFLICYFGQKIVDSTELIAHGCYSCGWEGVKSPKVRQAIMHVVQRAQKPVRLTALNFADISFKSFTSVC